MGIGRGADGAGATKAVRLVRSAALAVAAVVASGCYWAQPGFDAHRGGFNSTVQSINASNVDGLEERWSAPAGALEVIATGNGVHALSSDELRTYDPVTGALRWSAAVETGDLFDVPVLGAFDNRLVIPSANIGDPDGCLQQYDAATGAYLHCTILHAPSDSIGGLSVDAVRSGAWVVVTYRYGSSTGPAAAIAATNTSNPNFRWIVELGSGAQISNPIVVDGTVYAYVGRTTSSTLVGWDLELTCAVDCEPVVAHPMPHESGFGISADPSGARIAVATDGGLRVVDRSTGAVTWTGTYPDDPTFDARSVPTWTPTSLVVPLRVGSPAGTLVVAYGQGGCGSSTCAPAWTANLPGGPQGQAAAAADVVFVTSERALAAFPTACSGTCAPAYLRQTSSWTWFSGPIVSHGMVVHSPGGEVEALVP